MESVFLKVASAVDEREREQEAVVVTMPLATAASPSGARAPPRSDRESGQDLCLVGPGAVPSTAEGEVDGVRPWRGPGTTCIYFDLHCGSMWFVRIEVVLYLHPCLVLYLHLCLSSADHSTTASVS